MKKEAIVRAWKDPEYRARLTAEEREALPEPPCGTPLTELDEAELGDVVGGRLPLTPRSCIGKWCPPEEVLF